MLKYSAKEIIEQIEQYRQNLLIIRSITPHLKFDGNIGQWESAPFYRNMGYHFRVSSVKSVEGKDINLAAHSVNQSFVIRLYAYLEYCGVYEKIIDLDGHDKIRILRLLRNKFVHTSGYYNPDNEQQKKIYEETIKCFNLDRKNHPESDSLFPIPIDTVLEPLAEGCKRYVNAVHNHEIRVEKIEFLYKLQYLDEKKVWCDILIADIDNYCTLDLSLVKASWRDYETRHPDEKLRILEYKPRVLQSKDMA